MAQPELPDRLDVGCGPMKAPGAWGVDGHGYPGVDQVLDLDSTPWDLPDDHFQQVIANHVIEHVADIPAFLREIHRVAKAGAEVRIATPHFTGISSWSDPTHRWHLACGWHRSFTDAQRYLGDQLPRFAHASTTVAFPGGLRGRLGRLLVRVKGADRWETRYGWLVPASEFTTVLTVVK